MSNKYLSIDLDDPRIKNLSDVISNKTCKKILDYLADNEACETEIARDLKLPANTVNYNVKKLLKSGLIEKSKVFFWSVKGRKIIRYKVANKKILISPKPVTKTVLSLLGSVIITGLIALGIKSYTISQMSQTGVYRAEEDMAPAAGAVMSAVEKSADVVIQIPEIWIWFLLGGICSLIIYVVLSKVRWFR